MLDQSRNDRVIATWDGRCNPQNRAGTGAAVSAQAFGQNGRRGLREAGGFGDVLLGRVIEAGEQSASFSLVCVG
jgi:hypothetical protein